MIVSICNQVQVLHPGCLFYFTQCIILIALKVSTIYLRWQQWTLYVTTNIDCWWQRVSHCSGVCEPSNLKCSSLSKQNAMLSMRSSKKSIFPAITRPLGVSSLIVLLFHWNQSYLTITLLRNDNKFHQCLAVLFYFSLLQFYKCFDNSLQSAN